MVELLNKGVVACLDGNNKDDFDVDIRYNLGDLFEYFLLAHPLE